MTHKVLLLVSTIVFCAVATNGCAPDLTTTDPDEPWGGSGGTSSSSGDGGSNSSSSSSGNSSSSSSSSSGAPGVEACLDGVDNDGDGAADCADSDCNDYDCIDAPPAGWSIVSLKQGSGAPPSAATCPDGSLTESFYTGMAGPAECIECMCGSLTGAQCKFTCYRNSTSCSGTAQDWTAAIGGVGSCSEPTGLLGGATTLSCHISGSVTGQAGNCTATAADFPNKDTWSGWIQSCTMKQTGTGCGALEVCVDKPSVENACIGQPGQHICPAGWPNKMNAYQGGSDTRACTQCTCTPAPTCTGGLVRFIDADGCSSAGNDPDVFINDATCRDVSQLLDNGLWSIRYQTALTAGGSCTAGGGVPTGSITPTGEMTFCCK